MLVKSIVASVALLASTAGCFVAAEAEGEGKEATASSSDEPLGAAISTIAVGAPDDPMPLDHPVQVPEVRLRAPWQLPSFDVTPEPEEWEHNPRTFGCVMRYVRIFDPRGERIEIPITECR